MYISKTFPLQANCTKSRDSEFLLLTEQSFHNNLSLKEKRKKALIIHKYMKEGI